MKAIKYIDELIDLERDYLSGYEEGKQPIEHINRLKDLEEARKEAFDLGAVVGQSEQLHECSHRRGEECIKPSSCSAFGCNKPM